MFAQALVVQAADVLIYSLDIFEEEANTLIIDADNTGGDVTLQFGETLSEQIFWDNSSTQFVFTDDLNVQGNIAQDGTSFTLDADNAGAGSNVSIIANQGSDNDGTIRYNATTNQWEFSNDGGAFTAFGAGGGNTLDEAYDQGGAGSGRTINADSGAVDIEGTGELIELGDGTAADSFINFDDGTDRNFGWDDSAGALSTFDQELRFRTRQGSTPPTTCSSTVAGMQWFDTDTGILYVCDTSNSRNKWLSLDEVMLFGEESGACASGTDTDSDADCSVVWGNGLGADNSTNLGLYIPHNITITAAGFSQDNDACLTGSFDLEIRGTGSAADDNTYTGGSSVQADIATGQSGETYNANNLNVDLDGGQYTIWGLDNNCGQSIDDWNMIIYFRWRHD